jgi:catechol 2,3-dioxygenase
LTGLRGGRYRHESECGFGSVFDPLDRGENVMALVSQLAHVELTTPVPQESLDFWKNVIGLEETTRVGQSVYLRGWGDRFHHTLVITEGEQAGLGHIGWRAAGPDALETAVQRLEAAGVGEGWAEENVGYGRAFRYRSPGGHLHHIFWDVERYVPPAGMESPFPNRPQRYVPRGVAARCIDHVTITAANPAGDSEWYRDTLGHRWMEYTTIPDRPDFPVFCMTTTCERAHDLGIVWDPTPVTGRINHMAYFVDSREELLRAADVLLNQDVAIEFGPGKHGMGEQDYLYAREPSGLRVELNAGGYRNYEPDYETVRYEPQAGSNVFYKNLSMPHSMFESFPLVALPQDGEAEAKQATGLFV